MPPLKNLLKQDSLRGAQGDGQARGKRPSVGKNPRQVDENGIPIKKQKSVRKQKVIEEISLKFRVVSQSEEEE